VEILIVNAIGIQVVSAVRSLSALGHEVCIALPQKHSSRTNFFAPKGLSKIYNISNPSKSQVAFTKDILDLLKREIFDVVLPFGFATTVALSLIKGDVEKYTNTSIADYDLIQVVHNKFELHKHLNKNNFIVPKIYNYKSIVELKDQDVNYPVVIKARKGC